MNEPAIRVGDAEIHPILESILWLPPALYLPDVKDVAPLVQTVSAWAEVTFADDGWVAAYVRSYVIKADGQVGIVDAGIGANSLVEGSERFRVDLFPYRERLSEAGVAPDDVDWVVSTHMHFDHIGWYAERVGDRWVTVFPTARYLFVRAEREHAANGDELTEARLSAVEDAGLVDFVDTSAAISPSVRLEPSPGHTPGHVYVSVTSNSEQALIIGDVLHHKLQLAVPDERDGTDVGGDPELAMTTRSALFERLVDSDILMLAGHYEPPAAGYLVPHGAGYAVTTKNA